MDVSLGEEIATVMLLLMLMLMVRYWAKFVPNFPNKLNKSSFPQQRPCTLC